MSSTPISRANNLSVSWNGGKGKSSDGSLNEAQRGEITSEPLSGKRIQWSIRLDVELIRIANAAQPSRKGYVKQMFDMEKRIYSFEDE